MLVPTLQEVRIQSYEFARSPAARPTHSPLSQMAAIGIQALMRLRWLCWVKDRPLVEARLGNKCESLSSTSQGVALVTSYT
jgi:hypothetical protein